MDLQAILDNVVPAMGYELVDVEHAGRGLLRVFIDRPGGVTVDDCALVSNQLTRVFAVEGIDYERLEVSSPGLDRPLKKTADYQRFTGREARVTLRAPVDGRRRFAGVLIAADDGEITLEVNGRATRLKRANIEKARLVADV